MIVLFYIIFLVALLSYLYIKWAQSYWHRKGVEYIQPEFYYGNFDEIVGAKSKIHRSEAFKNFYLHFKKNGLRFGGAYKKLTPTFIPVDLDLIKAILQTDFSHFVNHDGYVNEEVDPLTGNLFSLKDEKWKKMRAKLTPTFTSGKMKMMFTTMVECTTSLEKLLNEYALNNEAVDIRDTLARFTTDIISSVAFGVESKSLQDSNSPFRKIGLRIFNPRRSFFLQAKRFFAEIFPEWVPKLIKIKLGNPDFERFFLNWVKNMVEYREKNNVFRKDFMHLLIQLKNMNEVYDDEKLVDDSKKNFFLSLEEITAQCFVFFIAGFETSSSTMTSVLMNLALNQDIQEKTREEILRVLEKYNNKITYDSIMEMKYLDQVLSETLRKDGAASSIRRECNTDYKVPNSDLIIEKGTIIRIPVHGIHHDPEYYPNPEIFDPDRFTPENKHKIPSYAYLPFGEGPRACIGLRFGKLQVKVGLCSVLKNYKVSINNKTKLPIKMSTDTFLPSVEGGLWLNLTKI